MTPSSCGSYARNDIKERDLFTVGGSELAEEISFFFFFFFYEIFKHSPVDLNSKRFSCCSWLLFFFSFLFSECIRNPCVCDDYATRREAERIVLPVKAIRLRRWWWWIKPDESKPIKLAAAAAAHLFTRDAIKSSGEYCRRRAQAINYYYWPSGLSARGRFPIITMMRAVNRLYGPDECNKRDDGPYWQAGGVTMES